jgi:hypothetical protein
MLARTPNLGHYDTAQICRNGHVITSNYNDYPAHRQNHCDKCGAATITKCESCGTDIRGEYEVPGVAFVGAGITAAGFCHACGKPYPWTVAKLQAAKELVGELDDLDAGERESLKITLDDLVKDTPKTEVASIRFKKLMKKVGKESYEAVKTVVTDLVSESIKKSLFSP